MPGVELGEDPRDVEEARRIRREREERSRRQTALKTAQDAAAPEAARMAAGGSIAGILLGALLLAMGSEGPTWEPPFLEIAWLGRAVLIAACALTGAAIGYVAYFWGYVRGVLSGER